MVKRDWKRKPRRIFGRAGKCPCRWRHSRNDNTHRNCARTWADTFKLVKENNNA